MSLRAAYRARLQSGEISPDPAQAAGLDALGRLEGELNAAGEPSFLARFRKPKALRGVYLWGAVGRGKSMLMDLFFANAPIDRKRRTHFHAFMAEVHRDLHAWRSGDAAARRDRFGQHKGDDPIAPTAELIARDARLLCLDELQVTDIADAMILGRLFEALFDLGVTLVCTSNRRPDDLYADGLNRQLFLPFIALIDERLQVVELTAGRDWRLDRLLAAQVYFSPIDPDNRRAFDELWRRLLDGDPTHATELEVLGRTLDLPRTAGGMVRTGFADLCTAALGPQDYLALADRFHTVFLEDVPKLTPERRNEARRFVNLIDTLYEAHARLVLLAAAQPGDLYPAGDGAFEFERTSSRLQEMRSRAYLDAQNTSPLQQG